MSDVERKCVGASCEIKNADQGEIVAVVATLDVVDRETDVWLTGALRKPAPVKLSEYGHSIVLEGSAPVGVGTIAEEGNKAILRARYFMTTTRGREAFNLVKELGSDGDWSFGFPRSVQTAELTPAWRAKGARRLITGI